MVLNTDNTAILSHFTLNEPEMLTKDSTWYVRNFLEMCAHQKLPYLLCELSKIILLIHTLSHFFLCILYTDHWLFEGTWWSTNRVILLFRLSVASDQSPGHKKMIESPLPES